MKEFFDFIREEHAISGILTSTVRRGFLSCFSYLIPGYYYKEYEKSGNLFEVRAVKGKNGGMILGAEEFIQRTLNGDKRKERGKTSTIDLAYLKEKLDKDIDTNLVDISGCLIYHYRKEDAIVCIDPFMPAYILVYSSERPDWIKDFIKYYQKPKDEGMSSVYYLIQGSEDVYGKQLWFKNIETDIDMNYNDDLPYEELKDFCNGEEGGLAVLFGQPGTGKTSLIKKLIGDCQEDAKFFIIKPEQLKGDHNKEYLEHFLDNQGATYIIEDCEDLLMSREMIGGNRSGGELGTLLNMTDGILGSVLNVKIICTFNTSLKNIDKALLRKGRLKFKYEFKKLALEKTKALKEDATEPMTLAEIYNDEIPGNEETKERKIGF